MGLLLFALFLGVPIIEITLFIVVGGQIGVLATIAIVVATAIAGAWLVRLQGFETLKRAQADIDRNVIPTGAMAEGLAILVAGALLLTPGFLTDAIGFTLLMPQARRFVIKHLAAWLAARMTIIETGDPSSRTGSRETVIDLEATEIDASEPRDNGKLPREPGSSPWRAG